MATASSLTSRGVKNAYDSIAASTTDSSLVAAVTGKKIRVHAVFTNNSGTVGTLLFESGTATAITPTMDVAADGGGAVMPFNPVGWFETAAGEALTATTAAGAGTTGIIVVYSVVDNAR